MPAIRLFRSWISVVLDSSDNVYTRKGLQYLIMSYGPAKTMALDGGPWGFIPYDPSNGTISLGQIAYYGPGGQRSFRSF